MPFASTSARTLRGRSIPFLTASALSISIYTIHTYTRPILNDSPSATTPAITSEALVQSAQIKKGNKYAIDLTSSPYTPLGWGSNRYLTLLPDNTITNLKRPTPLVQLGSTPLRDLVIAEKYGACVDARGDCWMWGAGYDPSGMLGQALRGKKLRELAPAPAKVIALSKDGHLYAFSASKAAQSNRQDKKEQSWLSWLLGSDAGIDYIELKAAGGLKSGEKWAGMSAGTHHLLAVTTKGRAFSLPLSPAGNTQRQLGTRQDLSTLSASSVTPTSSSTSTASDLLPPAQVAPESDPRYVATLTEIPSLSGIEIAQVATSDRSSFVRTPNGRVLGFGANELGQIGLGANATVETVQTPVEIVLGKSYPGGTSVDCKRIVAGGSTTFFLVERSTPGKQGTFIDLLACGTGISGSLGNGLWSSANGVPGKVKTVSGLQEYSETAGAFLPLGVHTLSVSSSPSAHIFAVLETMREAEEKGVKQGLYGRDVMVWGGNAEYQLGNGKRSSLAVPQHLPPLVQRAVEASGIVTKEAGLSSGSLSPMPHSRLQLHETKADAYDLNGKLIKRGVRCEETVVAGYNASVLYNKIIG